MRKRMKNADRELRGGRLPDGQIAAAPVTAVWRVEVCGRIATGETLATAPPDVREQFMMLRSRRTASNDIFAPLTDLLASSERGRFDPERPLP
jgi:hypothetical protein